MNKILLIILLYTFCFPVHGQNAGYGDYDGKYKKGKKHGKGTFIWPDGSKYEGEWRNDIRHGEGTYTWPDGDVYSGEWEDNRINGYGTFKSKSGFEYTGEWKDDKHHGFGKYTLPNGTIYTGEFKEGIKHGVGTMEYPDGTVVKGIWEDGFYVPCDCDPFLTTKEAYNISSAVFVGKAVDIAETGLYDQVVLSVEKLYKGGLQNMVLLEVEYTSCHVHFEIDQSYLVYAFQFEDGVYSTDMCARTKNIQQASLDIEMLDGLMICNDEDLKNTTGACEQVGSPVCGCDGKTYRNPCEAAKQGISSWASGKCQ